MVVRSQQPAALHCRPPAGASVAWRHGTILLSPAPDRWDPTPTPLSPAPDRWDPTPTLDSQIPELFI